MEGHAGRAAGKHSGGARENVEKKGSSGAPGTCEAWMHVEHACSQYTARQAARQRPPPLPAAHACRCTAAHQASRADARCCPREKPFGMEWYILKKRVKNPGSSAHTCVVLPDPVSPDTTTTSCAASAATSPSRIATTGSLRGAENCCMLLLAICVQRRNILVQQPENSRCRNEEGEEGRHSCRLSGRQAGQMKKGHPR